MTVILKAAHVDKRVDQSRGDSGRLLLQDVSLTASTGEFLSIIGPSGAGKTTLLHCLSGIQPVTVGRVTLMGRDLGRLSVNQQASLRRTGMSFIFQDYNLLPALPVIDNIVLPLRLAHQPVAIQKVQRWLDALDFKADLHQFPAQLSGGERQKVAIVRALVTHAQIIFADEPTGALDAVSRELIFKQLRDLTARGITIVMVTHDIELAAQTDRAIVLRDGRLVKMIPSPDGATLLAALRQKEVTQHA